MKQILQSLSDGSLEVSDVPSPGAAAGKVLIRTGASLISAGTERMLMEFGQAGWIGKARSQPEKVRQVLDKMRTDGVAPTLEAVFRKLDEPLPLGYCNAGVVVEVGAGVTGLRPGDRVASNGPHAEFISVPPHLCARIPDEVTDAQASFTVLGAVALQGVRLAAPTLGERFLVMGLGLLGQLAVQLLRADGCRVLGVDPVADRRELARRFGADTVGAGDDSVAAALEWSGGRGVDGVLITASAETDAIVHQAAAACRQRGRIVLVGVVGLGLRRSDFYEKELTFQVSCSYGPGRYDERYEQGGHDYPFGFVRWTEQRNFEAVLELLRAGALKVDPLITDRFPLAVAPAAYEKIQKSPAALGVILEYPAEAARAPAIRLRQDAAPPAGGVGVGVIGAGQFARGVLLPALARTPPARLEWVADLDGKAAAHAGRKFGAAQVTTDHRRVLDDPRVQAVCILTGHHLHAPLAAEALAAGKHVFVEKPLAIRSDELDALRDAVAAAPDRQLAVGFNRRFSPHTERVRRLLEGRTGPLALVMTVNAGAIPANHWIQDPARGGGRIVGEGCHFVDLLAHLAGHPVVAVTALMAEGPERGPEDQMSITLGFADGSVGTVHYFSGGSKRYPKETLEVFGGGRVIRVDNFRVTRGFGCGAFRRFATWRQDKGHRAEAAAFVDRVAQGGPPLMPFAELENATRATFAAVTSAREKRTIILG